MSFPASPLDLRCEVDAGSWTDVSTLVYQRDGQSPKVNLSRGRQDESSQATPGSCRWEWNNRDGRFSPKNPLSPYYGLLGRNTPVRWSVPAQSNYLRLENNNADRAYVNDNSGLHVTGSIDMQAQLRLTDWRGCVIACKWDGGAAWSWLLNGDGTVSWVWWDGAHQWNAQSTVPAPFTSGTMALRATMNASTGTVTFYTAAAIGGPWTQLGAAVSPTGGAATAIAAGTGSALAVGYSFNFGTPQMFGSVHEFRLYNGIAGTLVADGIFTAQAAGATSWTDGQGNLWQLAGGAEISSRDYRFHGEMSSQPPKWDVTGTDMAVAAQAGGPLRRLQQGTANAQSAMRRAVSLQPAPFTPDAYWTMEDAAGAASLGSATGGPALLFDGSPALATDSSFLASAPLPSLNFSRMHGKVARYTSGGSAICRFLAKFPSAPPSGSLVILRLVTTGRCRSVELSGYNGGGLGLAGYDSSGATVFNTGGIAFAVTGQNLWMSAELQVVSGNVQYSITTLAPGATSGTTYNGTYSGAIGNITDVFINPQAAWGDTVLGHLQVQSAWSSLFNLGQPLNAWQGEAAGNRFTRLAGENGYQARVTGSPAVSAPMGPQGIDTLANLLQACEAADLGQVYEPRQCAGALGYRTLASMLNQAPRVTLDYAQSQPGGVNGNPADSGLDPVYDDQLTRNDWTLTRGSPSGAQGATYQAQLADGSMMSTASPPAGAGDYAGTATVNVQYDSQLPDTAGWMVHTGTVDEARWPLIPVNLARAAIQNGGLVYPVLDTDIGDYAELLNIPDQVTYDPVRQLVLGVRESLGGFHHTVELNAAPESPFEVAVLDDPVYGRADTDGSSLAGAVTAAATVLGVVTAAGFPQWTTAAADFPFDAGIAGERVTVASAGGPGNFLTGQNAGFDGGIGSWTGNGCAVSPVTSPVHSGTGALKMTATASGNMAGVSPGMPVSPGDTVSGSAWFQAATTARTVAAALVFYNAAGGFISGIYPGGSADAAGSWVQQLVSGTAPALAATARLYAYADSVVLSEVHYVDDAVLADVTSGVQAFTVTRAVNGVSKAQAAGADVRLWFPPILSLA